MGAMAYQITSLTIVYSSVYSDADQRKHQSSASLAFMRGIHRGPLNSPHKWPVPRKMFPFDDVIIRFRAQGTTRSPLCSIQGFKMFGWLRNTLWANETSWNLSLRRGYGGMSCILPGPCLNIKTVFLCMRIAIITIRRSYLYNGPYTDTTTYLYWDAPQPLYPWLSLIYYRPFIHIQFK